MFHALHKEIQMRRPGAAVLIDSPDFNLRLARKIKKLGIPILYYISPTVWAWRKSRLKSIKRLVDKILLIFPFEKDIYQRENIPHAFVGHPLLERIGLSMTRQGFFSKYGLDPGKKTICLLPGSRSSEINFHMPVLVETAARMAEKGKAQFVLVKAENISLDQLEVYLHGAEDWVKIVENNAYEAIGFSDLVLSSCGTATLEAALLKTPAVAFYRLSSLSYRLGVKFIKIKHYSIVNILAGREVIGELIQKNMTPENLIREAEALLGSAEKREGMVKEYQKVRDSLGGQRASYNAALELRRLLARSNL
jgi:lipid-A-disaccharide synthase